MSMTIEEMRSTTWGVEYLAMLEHALTRYEQQVQTHGAKQPLYGYVCESLMGFAGDLVFSPESPNDTETVKWKILREEPFDLNTNNKSAAINLLQAYTNSIPILAADPMYYMPIESRSEVISKIQALEARAHHGGLESKQPYGLMLVKLQAGCPYHAYGEQGERIDKIAEQDMFVVKTNRSCPIAIDYQVKLLTSDFAKAKSLYDSLAKECTGSKQMPTNGIIDERFQGVIVIPGAYSKPDPQELQEIQANQFML